MSARRPYRRPMQGWWRRNPWFREYMAHEATAFAVALYALLLLAGLWALGNGPQAWAGWLALLRSGPMLAVHSLLLLAIAYHVWSWFAIMPRTLPPIEVGGKRLAAATITRLGLGAAFACTVLLLLLARIAA